MLAVDTNILVYSHRVESSKHTLALSKITAVAESDEPWFLPVFCLGEFIRVVTHPKVFNPPSKLENALVFVDALLKSPSVQILYPGKFFWKIFSETTLEGQAKGNLAFDAMIASLLIENGVEKLLTDDRDFGRFKRIKTIYL